jgi:hypothetical protein
MVYERRFSESQNRGDTVISQSKERARIIKWSMKEGFPKVKIERKSSLEGQTCVESRAWRLLSAVGAMGVPLAPEL